MSFHLGLGPTEYTGHRPGDHEYSPSKGRARTQNSNIFGPPVSARDVKRQQDRHTPPIRPDDVQGAGVVWDSMEREEAMRRRNAEHFEALREGKKPPSHPQQNLGGGPVGIQNQNRNQNGFGGNGNNDNNRPPPPPPPQPHVPQLANRRAEDAQSGARIFGVASPPRERRIAFAAPEPTGGNGDAKINNNNNNNNNNNDAINRGNPIATEHDRQQRRDEASREIGDRLFGSPRPAPVAGRRAVTPPARSHGAANGAHGNNNSNAEQRALDEMIREEKLAELRRIHESQRDELERKRAELERKRDEQERREAELDRKREEIREKDRVEKAERAAYLPTPLEAAGVAGPNHHGPIVAVSRGDAGALVPVYLSPRGGGGGGGGGGGQDIIQQGLAASRIAATESRLARLEEDLRAQLTALADERSELAQRLRDLGHVQRLGDEKVAALQQRVDETERFAVRFHDELRRKAKQDDGDITRLELSLRDARVAAEEAGRGEKERGTLAFEELRRLRGEFDSERASSERHREHHESRVAAAEAAARDAMSHAARVRDDVVSAHAAVSRLQGSLDTLARQQAEALDAARHEWETRARDSSAELKHLVARVVSEFTHAGEERDRAAENARQQLSAETTRLVTQEREERQRRELEVATRIDRELRARDQREAETAKMLLEKHASLEAALEAARTERDADLARLSSSFDQLAQATERQVRGEIAARRQALDAQRSHYDAELASLRGRVAVTASDAEHRHSTLAEVVRAEIKSRLYTHDDLRARVEHLAGLNEADHQALQAEILSLDDAVRGRMHRLESREAAARSELLATVRSELSERDGSIQRAVADVEVVAAQAARRVEALDAAHGSAGERVDELRREIRGREAAAEVARTMEQMISRVESQGTSREIASLGEAVRENRVALANVEDGALAQLEEAHAELADALEALGAETEDKVLKAAESLEGRLGTRIDTLERTIDETMGNGRVAAGDAAAFAAVSDCLGSVVARVAEAHEHEAWLSVLGGVSVFASASGSGAGRGRGPGGSTTSAAAAANDPVAFKTKTLCDAAAEAAVAPLRSDLAVLSSDLPAHIEREIAQVHREIAGSETRLREDLDGAIASVEATVDAAGGSARKAEESWQSRIAALEDAVDLDLRPGVADAAAEAEQCSAEVAALRDTLGNRADAIEDALKAEIAERETLAGGVEEIRAEVATVSEAAKDNGAWIADRIAAEDADSDAEDLGVAGPGGKKKKVSRAVRELAERVDGIALGVERELAHAHAERARLATEAAALREEIVEECRLTAEDGDAAVREALEVAEARLEALIQNGDQDTADECAKLADAAHERAVAESLSLHASSLAHAERDAASCISHAETLVADRLGHFTGRVASLEDDISGLSRRVDLAVESAAEAEIRVQEAEAEARKAAEEEMEAVGGRVEKRVRAVEERLDASVAQGKRAERAAREVEELREEVKRLAREIERLEAV